MESFANTKYLAPDSFLKPADHQNTLVNTEWVQILFLWTKSIMKFPWSLSKKYSKVS